MSDRAPHQQATVFTQALGLAVAAAAQRDGASPLDVCARIGLDPALLGRPDARVPHELMCRVWTALSLGDEELGLRAARIVDAAPQSLVEYTLASAGDVRASLRGFVRFQRLIHDASAHTLEEGASTASFCLSLLPGYTLPFAVWDYLAATMVLRFRRQAQAAIEPVEVRLPRPPFVDDGPARAVFRAPLRHGGVGAEVRYPRAFLDARLSTNDPTLFALLGQQLERALGLPASGHSVVPRADDDVLAKVRRELRTALPRGDASLANVARAAGTSARSLQRRLADRGLTFNGVVDDARRVLAEELLGGQRASVTETAFAAGFADVPAFSRAFRRWNGVPPGEWSRRQ